MSDRAIIERGANGDYIVRGTWEVYTDREVSRPELLQRLKAVVRVTMGSRTRVLRKSRWTEARKPSRRVSLLVNMHGLWDDAVLAWCKSHLITPRSIGQLALTDADLF